MARKTKLRRICPTCKKRFTLRAPNQIYCSQHCKDDAHYTPVNKTKACVFCGVPFVTSNKATHCSDFCVRGHKLLRLYIKRNLSEGDMPQATYEEAIATWKNAYLSARTSVQPR